jgi:hypothetical protein
LKICRLCSIPDTDINGNNPIAPLSLSSQTLFVNKNFCDAGRSILYGENTFIFTDFLMLEDFTQRIGSKAAENITKLTFTDNVNAVYAAQDFEVYPKLNTIRIILPYKDIPLNLHNPQHAVLFQGMAPQTVITLHPLPQRLYPGHCIPDQYDALFPNMLHFFATRIIQSIRDGELRVELVCRHRRRDRMNLHNWRVSESKVRGCLEVC